jgi:hypothetical protein
MKKRLAQRHESTRLAVLAGIVVSLTAQADRRVSIKQYELVSQTQGKDQSISRVHRATVVNSGTTTVKDLCGKPSRTLSGAVCFGDVAPGGTAVARTTSRVILGPEELPFDEGSLIWTFVSADGLEGDPGDPAMRWSHSYLGPAEHRHHYPRDGFVVRNLLKLIFRADVTVTQLNAAVRSCGGRIEAVEGIDDSVPGLSAVMVIVELPDPGSVAALKRVQSRLETQPAVLDVLLEELPVPPESGGSRTRAPVKPSTGRRRAKGMEVEKEKDDGRGGRGFAVGAGAEPPNRPK